MRALELKLTMLAGLSQASGLEQRRDYVGMSRIHLCPLKLYREYLDGATDNDMGDWSHWFCLMGYGFQEMMTRLVEAGAPFFLDDPPRIDREVEVVAGFDARFRGHVDLLVGQTPVEFKSVSYDTFEKIMAGGKLPRPHYGQMQLYLRHGGFPHGLVVYVARDTPREGASDLPFWVFDVYPNPGVADALDWRAKNLLMAVDSARPPACECGRCA